MRIDRSLSLDSNPELVRDLSILIRRTHGVPTRRDTAPTAPTAARCSPSAPKVKRTDICADGGTAAHKRALVGNALNNEQWSDDLSNQIWR